MAQNQDHSDHANISTGRLEAFSDGVLAIIITITVLGVRIPAGSSLSDLKPLLPILITYLVSFQTVGTYWNNHHLLIQATDHISTGILWANLHLLFWLSLIPFATGWLGQNFGSHWPTAIYAGVLLCCALAYQILQFQALKHSSKREQLLREFRQNPKGMASLGCYVLAFLFAFSLPIVSDILILAISALWFVPDKRIQKYI